MVNRSVAVAAVVGVLVVVTAHAGQAVCDNVKFSAVPPSSNFAVGSSPRSVAVGDFNGDGIWDLAVANVYSNNVSILLGAGIGSFGVATNFAVGSGPISVAVGDFNGDGRPDLAVANAFSNDVSILLGTGSGSFGAATNFSVGSYPISVAVGDFNGDGTPDLAVANDGSNSVSILLGSGSGSFGPATNFSVGWYPNSVAVGDFNGDGTLDLAAVNSSGVSILLGTGTGSFGAATNFAAGLGSFSVAVGDFNGDGRPDLAVANDFSNNVSIMLGTGTGSFGAATNFAVGWRPRSVAVGDFNGDGTPDLAVANLDSNNVSILLGSGSGSFGPATNWGVPGSQSVAIADFNGDGTLDLAVVNGSGVSILLGTGTGSFGASFAAGLNPLSVVVGDFNGDGTPDLAVANYGSNNVSILLGTGGGNFGAAINFPVGAASPRSVAVGDFNGDGKLDLAVANEDGNAWILLGTGTGTFGAATNFPTGSGAISVAVGDFNGDGAPDLAAVNGSGVSILLGTGTGSFGAATNFAAGSSPVSVAVEDFNGDGRPDLAVADYYSNGVSILLNTCVPLAQGARCNGNGDCASGFCVDNVCCNSACGGGVATDCQVCSVAAGAAVDGTCGPASSTHVCRASTGACDVGEACDGVSLTCPADQVVAYGSQPPTCAGVLACTGSGSCAFATGHACSSESQCASGACVAGSCTLASNGMACNSPGQCTSGFCVDGVCCNSACGGGATDDCQACGVAAGATADGTCGPLTGTSCTDSNACTQTDTCQNGACVGGNPVTCPAPDQCHDAGTCNPSSGVCSNPNKQNGAACTDSNACTQTDSCQSGTCVGGNPVTCPTPDQCHDVGTCNPSSGVCSNPNKAGGSACDNGDGCPADTCQSGVCQPVSCPSHDTVVLPVVPLAVTIPAGKTEVTRTLRVTVRNADAGETAGHTVSLSVDDSDCGGNVAAPPNFNPKTLPPASTAVVLGGKTKPATVLLTLRAADFTGYLKAPQRCTLVLTATAVVSGGSNDPQPSNNVVPVELNVIDKNDGGLTARHETTLGSLRPVTVTISAGSASATKNVKPVVGNADATESPGDAISATAADGTCPAGTVGVIDHDPRAPGVQPSATVKGGSTKTTTLPLQVQSTGITGIATPNKLSPYRCVATASATGPGGDTVGTNNTTQLVIDVLDKNDY